MEKPIHKANLILENDYCNNIYLFFKWRVDSDLLNRKVTEMANMITSILKMIDFSSIKKNKCSQEGKFSMK